MVGGRQVAPAPGRIHAVRQIGHTKVETTKKFLRRLLAFILKAVSQAASRLQRMRNHMRAALAKPRTEQKTAAGPGSVARSGAAGPGPTVTVVSRLALQPYKL